MDAAHAQNAASLHGSARLLDDCSALARAASSERRSVRARLESELGGELARLLFRALVGSCNRAGSPTIV